MMNRWLLPNGLKSSYPVINVLSANFRKVRKKKKTLHICIFLNISVCPNTYHVSLVQMVYLFLISRCL